MIKKVALLFVISFVFVSGACPNSFVKARTLLQYSVPVSSMLTLATDTPAVYLPLLLNEGDGTVTPSDETVIYLGEPITVIGMGVIITDTTATITAGGNYRATGILPDGAIAINTNDEVILTLDDVNITHSSGPAINVINAAKLSLVLATGTSNVLVDGTTYSDTDLKATLFSNDTLEISGDGELVITGNYKHGIASDDSLLISSGNITIVSTVKDGFHANDSITISAGTIQIVQSGSDGLESEGTLVVDGGTLTLAVADDGLMSEDTLTVNGGTIDISSGVEGIESKNNIIINDGIITIAVSDDGLNATNDITINGGQMYLDATADAIDSNGSLNFNGGVTVALGGDEPEGSLDCDNCTIIFDGGTVVAAGGRNSTPSDSSVQYIAVLGSRPVNTVLHIVRDSDGTDVLTFEVSRAYQSMIFTSADLVGDEAYIIYTGGSVSGGTDFYGLYTDATYSGGSVWANFTTDTVVTYVGRVPLGVEVPISAPTEGL